MNTPNSVQQLVAAGEPHGENSPLQIGQRLVAAGDCERRVAEALARFRAALKAQAIADKEVDLSFAEVLALQREYGAAKSPGGNDPSSETAD
jgi:hypothetical protein